MRVNTVSACTIITPRVEAALNRCFFKTATSRQPFSRVVLTALHSIDARSRPASRPAVTPVSSCAPSVGRRSTWETDWLGKQVSLAIAVGSSHSLQLRLPSSRTAEHGVWHSLGVNRCDIGYHKYNDLTHCLQLCCLLLGAVCQVAC